MERRPARMQSPVECIRTFQQEISGTALGSEFAMRRCIAFILAVITSGLASAQPVEKGVAIPTGQRVAPLAAPGATLTTIDPELPSAPSLRLGWVVNAVLSPDSQQLALVTAGINAVNGPDGKPVPPTDGVFIIFLKVVCGCTGRVGSDRER